MNAAYFVIHTTQNPIDLKLCGSKEARIYIWVLKANFTKPTINMSSEKIYFLLTNNIINELVDLIIVTGHV